MQYLSETIDGEYATVRSKVTIGRKNELSVDYWLHLVGAQWRAYDVTLDGVSLVSIYRAQFNRIIQISSYDHLVEEMQGIAPISDRLAVVEEPTLDDRW